VRIQSQAFFLEKAMNLKPKNWDKFQHYKDRCPPWIKLHRDLLNDRAFMGLPLASKALAPLLWLLASESKDGCFQADSAELEFRLRIASKDIDAGLKPLIDKGFFVIASGVLAECLQDAIPERETETEGETEKRQKKQPRGARLPADWVPSEELIAFCKTERPDLNPAAVADRFRDFWIAQPGTKGVKLDWDATWRNWVRNEKAGGGTKAAAKTTAMPDWASKRATSA
jgi:hypothetical protein